MARLTLHSLAGLGLGLTAGLMLQRTTPAWSGAAVGAAEVVIRAWTNAFQLLVAPLVMSHLFAAVTAGRPDRGHLGRVGAVTPLVFAGLLAIVAALSWFVTRGLLQLSFLSRISLPSPAGGAGAEAATAPGAASWVDGFVPPNLFAAAGTNNILPLMLFAVVFGIAARRLAPPALELLRSGAAAVGDAMFILVEWLLVVTPFVILALALKSGASSGLDVGGALLGFTALEITVLLIATAALYPIVTLVGRMGLGRFARAVYPAQIAAAATRSSLATLPSLLAAAERHLATASAAGYVLPLAGATLKLSRAVSGPVKLLFLATVLGLPLGIERITVFLITIVLLSPSTVGVPRVTSGSRSLPAYIAAGIPGEYVVLLGATTMLADIFMTVLNTTGYMASGVLVDRFVPVAAPHQTEGLEPQADRVPETVPARS